MLADFVLPSLPGVLSGFVAASEMSGDGEDRGVMNGSLMQRFLTPQPSVHVAPMVGTPPLPSASQDTDHGDSVDDLIIGSPLERYLEEHDAPFVAAACVLCAASNFVPNGPNGKRKRTMGPPVLQVYKVFQPGDHQEGSLSANLVKLATKMHGDGFVCDLDAMNKSAEWDRKIGQVVPLWKAARSGSALQQADKEALMEEGTNAADSRVDQMINNFFNPSDAEEPASRARRIDEEHMMIEQQMQGLRAQMAACEARQRELRSLQTPTHVEENRDVQQQTPTTATAYRSLSGGGTGVAYRCLSGGAILQPVPPTPSILALVVLKRHLEKERAAATAAA